MVWNKTSLVRLPVVAARDAQEELLVNERAVLDEKRILDGKGPA
jgi:hypothetical protein